MPLEDVQLAHAMIGGLSWLVVMVVLELLYDFAEAPFQRWGTDLMEHLQNIVHQGLGQILYSRK